MIISISGFPGAGKDTIAAHLIKNYGFVKLSFAGILKDITSILFGWERDLLEGTTEESRVFRETVDPFWAERLKIPGLTPRFVLNKLGTDILRNHFSKDIWMIALEKQIDNILRDNPKQNIVITDSRFSNEFDFLKKLGARFWNVQRKDLPQWALAYKYANIQPPEDIHPSAYEWLKESYEETFINNKEIEYLEKQVTEVICLYNKLEDASHFNDK